MERCDRWKFQFRHSKKLSLQPEYRIKWLGYPTNQASWEPGEHLEHSAELIKKYEQRVNSKRATYDEEFYVERIEKKRMVHGKVG